MSELPSIATDTNVLLDLAKEDETVIDCFDILRRRLPGSMVVVLPTVISFAFELDPATICARLPQQNEIRYGPCKPGSASA